MTSDLREILTRVAQGDLPPAEAAHLIDGDASPAAPGSAATTVRRLVIAADACRLTLVADPTVAEVAIDGPHGVTQDGETLRIGVGRVPPGAYQFEQQPPGRARRRFLPWDGAGSTVRMRVNPALAVDISSSAAGIDIGGLRAPLSFHLAAGSVKVTDHVGPIRGYTSSGSVTIDALIREGESRLDCELGSVTLKLAQGSDVRVRGTGELGSVSIGGRNASGGLTVTGEEQVVGNGTASLDVFVRLGTAKVSLP